MTSLAWNEPDKRFAEAGVDRGVLYVDGQDGVAWPGLVSVTEQPVGGQPRAFYIDGVKYLNISSQEEFKATIEAFYSPPEFDVCDGAIEAEVGVLAHQQVRRAFGFSFRSRIANSDNGMDFGYKIHLIYNALASPTTRRHSTLTDLLELEPLAWSITTRSMPFPNLAPTAHVVIDTRYADPFNVSQVEDILYGTEDGEPRFPSLSELYDIFRFERFEVVIDTQEGLYGLIANDDADVLGDRSEGFYTRYQDTRIKETDVPGLYTLEAK